MPYISGSPINAYCANCKSDNEHVVVDVHGKQVRTVRCKKCEQEDSFRAPRDKTKAALMEISKKKKAPAKPKRTRKAALPSPEVVYAKLMDGVDTSTAVKYNTKKPLEEGELVDHPKFGMGIVTVLTDANKCKIMFETGERMMICNRS